MSELCCTTDNQSLVFDKIIHNGTSYYIDKQNGIWDSNAQLVGTAIRTIVDGKPIISYEMFNRKVDTNSNIKPLLK